MSVLLSSRKKGGLKPHGYGLALTELAGILLSAVLCPRCKLNVTSDWTDGIYIGYGCLEGAILIRSKQRAGRIWMSLVGESHPSVA